MFFFFFFLFYFLAGEQLCDDQQRIFPQCSSLPPAPEHHAWIGDGCCLSGKGGLFLTL